MFAVETEAVSHGRFDYSTSLKLGRTELETSREEYTCTVSNGVSEDKKKTFLLPSG